MRWSLAGVCLLLTAGCGASSSEGSPSPDVAVRAAPTASANTLDSGVWTRLPDSPLSAREGSPAAYVDGEVVIIGGYSGPPCPPGASCVYHPEAVERDGAAYDPATGTWRRIANAPRPVPSMAPTAVVGDRLYLLAGESILVWDSSDDSWQEVTTQGDSGGYLVADGTRLVLASGSDENGARPDHVFNTNSGGWSTLPPDPLKPSFDRVLTSTPDGLVLTSKPLQSDGSPANPALVHAALLPPGADTWRTLPTTDQLGGWRWTWTGHRLVDPTVGGADGGQVNNYGRVIPYGGRLDPATGDWSPLPNAPEEGTGGWPAEALDGPLIAAGGWLYEDSTGSWTPLPRPEGAPATPGPSVWADDELIVYGGADWDLPDKHGEWTPKEVWSTGVWAYREP